MNDGADDSSTASTTLVAANGAVELAVDHPSILRPDAAAAAAASAAALHDSSSSGHVSPVDATNGQPNDPASNLQQVALPPPGKRYRSTPAKTFQCKGFGDCRMVFSRSEHLARHIRYSFSPLSSSAHLAFHYSIPAFSTAPQGPLERPARLSCLPTESCCSRRLQPSSFTRLSFIFISLPTPIALLPRRDVGTRSRVRKQIENGPPPLHLEPCESVQPCTYPTDSICTS